MLTILAFALLFAASLAFPYWGMRLFAQVFELGPVDAREIARCVPEIIFGALFMVLGLLACWKYYDLLRSAEVYVASWVGGGSIIAHMVVYPAMLVDQIQKQSPTKT